MGSRNRSWRLDLAILYRGARLFDSNSRKGIANRSLGVGDRLNKHENRFDPVGNSADYFVFDSTSLSGGLRVGKGHR